MNNSRAIIRDWNCMSNELARHCVLVPNENVGAWKQTRHRSGNVFLSRNSFLLIYFSFIRGSWLWQLACYSSNCEHSAVPCRTPPAMVYHATTAFANLPHVPKHNAAKRRRIWSCCPHGTAMALALPTVTSPESIVASTHFTRYQSSFTSASVPSQSFAPTSVKVSSSEAFFWVDIKLRHAFLPDERGKQSCVSHVMLNNIVCVLA